MYLNIRNKETYYLDTSEKKSVYILIRSITLIFTERISNLEFGFNKQEKQKMDDTFSDYKKSLEYPEILKR